MYRPKINAYGVAFDILDQLSGVRFSEEAPLPNINNVSLLDLLELFKTAQLLSRATAKHFFERYLAYRRLNKALNMDNPRRSTILIKIITSLIFISIFLKLDPTIRS